MKTVFTKGIMAIAIIALVASCSTSNDVASNRGIQKRKYNKGFFVSKNAKGLDTKKTQQKSVRPIELNEEIVEVINSQTDTKENISEINLSTNTELAVSDKKIASENYSTDKNISLTDNKTKKTETIENDNLETNVNKKITLNRQIKQHTNDNKKSPGSDVELILLVILAIIIPPLAVFLYEEASTRFWIDLILALLGWGLLAWILPGLVFIGGLAAIIYALLIVTGSI